MIRRLRDAWRVLTGRAVVLDLKVVAAREAESADWFAVDPIQDPGKVRERIRERMNVAADDGWQYNGRDDDGTTHYVHPNGGHIECSPGITLANGA